MIRWITDVAPQARAAATTRRRLAWKTSGVLVASGLIAGEALAGLITGWFNYKFGKLPAAFDPLSGFLSHRDPSYLVGMVVMALIALALIRIPLTNAGDPNEPAPPSAIM